jgi:hypothetical protein
VYGSTSTTRKPFVRILSSQASVPFYLAFYKEWWDARAASLGVRPRDLLDGFGIAPYVGFSPAIGWDKANHVLTEGTPSWREVADAWTVDQIIDRLRDSGQPATDSYITRHLGGTPGTYTWLPGGRMPGLVEDDIPLVAYEHGVSLTFRNSEYVTNATILADCGITPSQATELKATAKRLTDKIFAASRHPRMAEVVRWTIDNWQQRTGGTQMCYFMSVGALHPVNTFGLLEYVDQRQDILKPPYKYHAVLDWANSGAGRRTNLPPQLAATAVATLAATDTAIPVSVTDDDATRLATLISWTSPDGLGILACEPGTVRIRAPVPGDYTLVGIADDGAARSRLVLAVHADPRPPVLDVPATATMGAGRELLIPIALAWSDGDPAAIDLAARSQDTGLLPSGYLAIQGTGTQRTLVVRAASTASGTARIAITARVPTATISADLTVTITPVAPLPGVAVIGDLLADEDAGVALVPVSRIGGTAGRLEADVTVHDIASATIGSDVGNASATLVWEDGDASPRSLAVPLIADGTPEPTETVAIRLVAQRGARYASYRPAGTLTIRDTDAGRIAFTTVVAQVTEGERTVLLKVRRSRGRTGPLHATWRTLETPSAEPWQFDAAAGDLAWDDGVDGDRTIPIRIHASSAVTPLGVVPVDVSLTSTVGRVEVGRTAIVITDAQAHTLTSPWSRSGMGWNPTGGDALERDGLLELAMSGVLGWTQDGGQAVLRPAGAADAMETSILGFSGEPTAWAGVQWRSDATGMAPTVMLTVDASGQTRWSVRDTASGVLVTRNGPSAPIPAILRLERLGDRISGFANETRVGACDFAPAGAAAGCIGLVGSSQTSGFGTWSRALVQLAPTAVGGGG